MWPYFLQESVPVGYVPPACQSYMFWWPPLGISTGVVVGIPVNKFKQVSSDNHQMLVAGGDRYLRSQVWVGGYPHLPGYPLHPLGVSPSGHTLEYSPPQILIPHPRTYPSLNRMTDICENIALGILIFAIYYSPLFGLFARGKKELICL